MKKYLRIKDVAEYMSVSESTVRAWTKQGYLDQYRLNGVCLYKISDVDSMFDKFFDWQSGEPETEKITDKQINKTINESVAGIENLATDILGELGV